MLDITASDIRVWIQDRSHIDIIAREELLNRLNNVEKGEWVSIVQLMGSEQYDIRPLTESDLPDMTISDGDFSVSGGGMGMEVNSNYIHPFPDPHPLRPFGCVSLPGECS